MKKFETKGLRFYELCNEYLDKLEEQKKIIEDAFVNFDADQIEEIRTYIQKEDDKFEGIITGLITGYKNDVAVTGFVNEEDHEIKNWSNRDLSDRPKKELEKALEIWIHSVNQCLILT